MHLPQGLGQFWGKLNFIQKISLISLLLVLLALPAGLYLTGQSQEIRKKAAEEVQIPQLPQITTQEGLTKTVTVAVAEDTFVASQHLDTNFEGSTDGKGTPRLSVGSDRAFSNTPWNYQRALLLFDTSNLDKKRVIQKANLTFTFYSFKKRSSEETIESLAARVFTITSPWQASSVTWNTQPTRGELYGTSELTLSNSDTKFSWDITQLARQWVNGSIPNYGLMLMGPEKERGGTGGDDKGVYSKESNFPPTLEIVYETIKPPTASLTGPASGKTGEAMAFSAKAQGEQLQWTRIHWAKATSDLTQGSSWTMVAGNDNCNGASECSVTGKFAPGEAGEYWLAVTANNPGGSCSGNPKVAEVPGWSDCGANSRVKVSVSQNKNEVEQTLNLSTGYTLVGLTIGKSSYKAADFIKDMNSSFTAGSGKITYLFRYNADSKAWETYTTTKTTTTNFSVSPWEAYWVYTKAAGIAKISGGGGVAIPDSIKIPAGWSLWSSPIAISDIPDAKTLLAKAKEQGIALTSIWKWDAGAKQYVGYKASVGENNFSLIAGEGYWIYNGGAAKEFSLNTIPPPPVPGN